MGGAGARRMGCDWHLALGVGRLGLGPPTCPPTWAVRMRGTWASNDISPSGGKWARRGRHALPALVLTGCPVGRLGLGPPTCPPTWAVRMRGTWAANDISPSGGKWARRGRHALPALVLTGCPVGRLGLRPPACPPAWAVRMRGTWAANDISPSGGKVGAARPPRPTGRWSLPGERIPLSKGFRLPKVREKGTTSQCNGVGWTGR